MLLKSIKNIAFPLLVILLINCDGIEVDHVIGRFYITKIDYDDLQTDLSIEVNSGSYLGVVPPVVVAVGFTPKYIVVKKKDFIDSKTINYVIVSTYIEDEHWPERCIVGSYTYKEFEEKRIELGIPKDLKFKKTI